MTDDVQNVVDELVAASVVHAVLSRPPLEDWSDVPDRRGVQAVVGGP